MSNDRTPIIPPNERIDALEAQVKALVEQGKLHIEVHESLNTAIQLLIDREKEE